MRHRGLPRPDQPPSAAGAPALRARGASGRGEAGVLERLMAQPYFARPAPKALDRLDFGGVLAASGIEARSAEDGAATLVAFTAESVARAMLPRPPSRWLITGGGRHNPSIMAALAARLTAVVEPVEAVGWDGDALEAQCFAYLAVRSLRGLPISVPSTTGVPRPTLGGRLFTPPSGARAAEPPPPSPTRASGGAAAGPAGQGPGGF